MMCESISTSHGIPVMVNVVIELLRVIVAGATLLLASYYDLKSREVDDKLWLFFAVVGVPLNVYCTLQRPELLVQELASIVVGCGLGYAFFYLGLFGGADAKALICLSLTIPLYPVELNPNMVTSIFFPFSVLSNAALLSAVLVLPIFIRNLTWKLSSGRTLFHGAVSLGTKVLLLFTGLKLSFASAGGNLNFQPVEFLTMTAKGELQREYRLFIPAYEDVDVTPTKKVVESSAFDDEALWFTLSLPMLVFIAVGFFVNLLVGDLMSLILGTVFGWA
jgi:preflagellin peptidase FlaK